MRRFMGWLLFGVWCLVSPQAGNAEDLEVHSLARLDIVHLLDGKTVRGTVLLSGLRGLVLAVERGKNGVHQEKFIPRSQILRIQSGTAATSSEAGLATAGRQQDHPVSKENGSYVITEPAAPTASPPDPTGAATTDSDEAFSETQTLPSAAKPSTPRRTSSGNQTTSAGNTAKNKAAPFGLKSQGRRAGRSRRSGRSGSRSSRRSTSSNRSRTQTQGTPQDLIDRYTNQIPYLDESTIQRF